MSSDNDQFCAVHREVSELLPWYVNGTLEPNEASRVAAHIALCVECKREITSMDALAGAVTDSSAGLPAASENLLARSMDRIERFEAQCAKRRMPGKALRQFLAIAHNAVLGGSMPARFMIAAEFVAILLLIVGAIGFARQSSRLQVLLASEQQRSQGIADKLQVAEQQQSHYKTLAAQCAQNSDGVRITVAFREGATEKQIRELLSTISGLIVNGPSPQRFYTISVPVERGEDREQILQQALTKLEQRKEVVFFAGK